MKKKKLWITALLALLSLCLLACLSACGDKEKTITLSIEPEVELGERAKLKKDANFKPFSQDNTKYEFVGENPCNATFSHELADGTRKEDRWDTYISATRPGTVSIKVSYLDGDTVVAESNVVTVSFYAATISNADELKAIASSGRSYVLGADIDLSAQKDWTPIEGFTGKLFGCGHRISGLSVSSVNGESIGLFGTLQGMVQDLTVENAQITSRGDAGKAGIVAGTNKGTVLGVTVSGSVFAEYYDEVGGLVGFNDNGKILDCTNKASVTGADRVGGIVGSVTFKEESELLSRCRNEGAIAGKNEVGGIAGYLTCVRSDATYQVSDHENTGTVAGTSQVGGVFGNVYAFCVEYNFHEYNSYFEMSLLKNTGEVNGAVTGEDVGGLIGKAKRLTLLTVSENKANITGGISVGGFVGNSTSTNIKATGAKNENTITGKGKVGGFAGQGGVIEGAVNNGEIVCTGAVIEDGGSYAYVGGIAGYCTGLIGCENNMDIRVTLNGNYVGGLAGYVVVSESNCVDNNINHGSVTGQNSVGGVAGYLTCVRSNATYQVSNNENRGAVTGASQVGGVFGNVYAFYEYYHYSDYYSYFEMSVLKNIGEVNGATTGADVGGLIGKAKRLTQLTVSENTADVTGGSSVGGFVGNATDTNIKATGATNNSTVTGTFYVGGFAGQGGVIEGAVNSGIVVATGRDTNGGSYLGGIAGYCTGIVGCVNNIDIAVTTGGKYVGGIAGYVKLTKKDVGCDNTNNGKVSGVDYVGGIAGYITCIRSNETYQLTNNVNKNTVTGEDYIGGIAGYVYAFHEYYHYSDYYSYFEITNCTNEAEITGIDRVGGICGGYNRLKTDSNLMSTNTTLYGSKLGE